MNFNYSYFYILHSGIFNKDQVPKIHELFIKSIQFENTELYGDYVRYSTNIPSVPVNICFIEQISYLYTSNYLINDNTISGNEIDKNELRPTIYIGTSDVLNPNRKLDTENIEYLNAHLLDNNIWSYYLPLYKSHFIQKSSNSQTTKEILIKNRSLAMEIQGALTEIYNNHVLGLYSTVNSYEYIELIHRLVGQNKIGGTGGHGSQLKPFIFHSETRFRNISEDIIEKLEYDLGSFQKTNKGKKLKLNILLIDDFSNKSLSIIKKDSKRNSKLTILMNRITRIVSPRIQINFNIDNAITIDEGLVKIRKSSYDIILLDYLFSGIGENKDEFGTKFLEYIQTRKKLSKIQPFGKFWILPITAYGNAFKDDMRNKEISTLNQEYELSRGADFITTPYLFIFYFLSIIESQLKLAKIRIVSKTFFQELDSLVQGAMEAKKSSKLFEKVIALNEWFEDHKNNNVNSNIAKYVFTSEYGSRELSQLKKDTLKSLFAHLKTLAFNLEYRNFPTNEEIYIGLKTCRSLYTKFKQL